MAEFNYQGIMQGVPNFSFPSLATYVQDIREQLQVPLIIPEYAVAGEQEHAQKVSEILREDPYRLRAKISEAIKGFDASFQPNTLRPVPYGEYPELYKAAMFTVRVSRQFANMDVSIQIYREKSRDFKFQAMAIGYLNKSWLFISERFFMHPNKEMFDNPEVCFLLGHELGHAQCRHTTIKKLASVELGRNVEYSADRAGLIVCAKRMLEAHPSEDPAKAIDRAVLACIATLRKITLAYQDFVDWKSFDYDDLAKQLKAWRASPSSLGEDGATHPLDERRGLAMSYFSQSEMFWRLMGLEPGAGLLSDAHLNDLMNTLKR